MEFIKEASEYLENNNSITPYERCIILAKLKFKEFSNWATCKEWLFDAIQNLISSDDPQQDCDTIRRRIL